MSIFKRRKNPEQLVKLLKEALASPSVPAKVDKEGKVRALHYRLSLVCADYTCLVLTLPLCGHGARMQPVDELTKRMNQMKLLLYGEVRTPLSSH